MLHLYREKSDTSENAVHRSSRPEVFSRKGVLKNMQQIYRSKFTGENPRWSAILIKLQTNFI